MIRATGAFVLILCLAARAVAAPGPDFSRDESTAAAVGMLRRAVTPDRDGSHLPLLFALRQLRDPDLKSLFYQLAQSGDWQMQVHAVLGLGEIDPNHRVDPWLMTKIEPQAQEAVVATGLDLKLIGPDQITEILKWDKLSPSARLFLLAEQISLGQKTDPAEVAKLVGADDDNTAALAACLAAQLGDPAPLQAIPARLAKLNDNARDAVRLWLLEGVRRYHLVAAKGWVESVLSEPSLEPEVAYRAVFSLLGIDVDAGMKAWERQMGAQPSYQQRVRYGMVLLATGASVPVSAYDRLVKGSDDELVLKMAAVGRAISTGTDQSAALEELIDLSHMKSVEWAMDHLEEIPKEQAAAVYAHLIDRLGDKPSAQGDAIALAVRAVSKLFAIDPNDVLARLRAAPDDELLQQTILLGLFETDAQDVGKAAASLRRIGSGRADSLALLLMAKHLKGLSTEDVQKLGSIAGGGGRVSAILQVQAAWMYLKQTGQIEMTLASVFPKSK